MIIFWGLIGLLAAYGAGYLHGEYVGCRKMANKFGNYLKKERYGKK